VTKIFAVVLVMLLSACQGMGQTIGIGNEKFDPTWMRQHIVVGKTTKQDILGIYGEPEHKNTNSSGAEDWLYRKNHAGNNILSAVGNMIPGLSTANQAASLADVHSQTGYDDGIIFDFTSNGVLSRWH